MMSAEAARYEDLVAQFRRLTGHTGDNGRCCAVTRGGVPQCCFQIADGDELTFTMREAYLLMELGMPEAGFRPGLGGSMFVLNRSLWNPTVILDSTHDGALANTLECASHPTRPVIVDGIVVAVVVVKDCNTPVALEAYRDCALTFRRMWQEAFDLVGMKPYYVSTRLSDGLLLL